MGIVLSQKNINIAFAKLLVVHSYSKLLLVFDVQSKLPCDELPPHEDGLVSRDPLLLDEPVDKVLPREGVLDVLTEAEEARPVRLDDAGIAHVLDELRVLVLFAVDGLTVDGGDVVGLAGVREEWGVGAVAGGVLVDISAREKRRIDINVF